MPTLIERGKHMQNTIEKVKFFFTPQATALRELERIRVRKAAMQADHAVLTEELRSIEASAGAELLDATDASALSRLGKKILQTRTEAELIGRAIALATFREAEAELTVKRTEIAALRAEALSKTRLIVELEAKSAPLLRQLSELEGVPFTRAALQAQPIRGASTISGVPMDLCYPSELSTDIDFAFGVTKSRKLHDESVALLAQARDLENRLEKSLPAQRETATGVSPGGKAWSELEHITGGSHRSLA